MQTASLRTIGTKVQRHGIYATVMAANVDYTVLEYENFDLPPEAVSIEQLEAEFGNVLHLVRPEKPVQSLPKTLTLMQRIEINRRKEYVRVARQLSKGTKGVGGKEARKKAIDIVATKSGDKNPPSPAQLGRWSSMENTLSLGVADNILRFGRKSSKSKFEYLKPIALSVFDEYYLKSSLPGFQSTFDIFVGRVQKQNGENADYPCYATFINWIKDICPYEESKKRNGKLSTRELMRNAVDKMKTDRPLQRVEFDGLRLAIGLVDDNGNYLGMVTLILAIDCHTRCILGYCLHPGKGEPASTYIHAYRHALCPKPQGSYNPNCENDWPMYGVWEITVVDGGTGPTSLSSQSFLNTAGIPIDVVQTGAGWKKPTIERFNYTVRSNFAQHLSSYCGHDLTRVQDYTLRQKASMTPDMFRAAFEKWLLDEYHASPHSGINNKTPYQAWKEAFKDPAFAPMLPANYEQIKLPQGETRHAYISGDACHQGVQINNVRYNDIGRKLKTIGLKLRRNNEQTVVECHYSVTDISKITVVDPFTEQTFVVNAIDNDIVSRMSLAEFDAIRVKRYKNKGVGRKRTFVGSDEYKATEEAYEANPNRRDTIRRRVANVEQMAEGVRNQQAQYDEDRAKESSGTPGDAQSSASNIPKVDLSKIGGHKHD
jgi:hypothetical protein